VALEDRLDRMSLAQAAAEPVGPTAQAEPDYARYPPPGARSTDETREKILNKIAVDVRRDAVRELVKGAIETEVCERGEAVDVEQLLADLEERLEDGELNWRHYSLADRVRSICADLGVPFVPSLWDEDTAEDGSQRTTLAPHYDEGFRFQGSVRAVVEPPKCEPP
jgi:hypothetical protein